MKIYTRTGDNGTTSLYGGRRVHKYNLQVTAYGTVDELNSILGVLISQINNKKVISSLLSNIQSDLFTIGAYLAGKDLPLQIIEKRVTEMEHLIDDLDRQMPDLKHFILPSGGEKASFTHLARAVCRRAEREITSLTKERKIRKEIIIYLNRLSDLLFMLARFFNYKEGIRDKIWKDSNLK